MELQANFTDSEKSWSVGVADVDSDSFDMSVKNPNKEEEAPVREPEEIIAEIVALDAESAEILEGIGEYYERRVAAESNWRCSKA